MAVVRMRLRAAALVASLAWAAGASAAEELEAAAALAARLEEAGVGQVVRFSAETHVGEALRGGSPVVMMHGMGDFGSNPMGMEPLRKSIAEEAGAHVRSVELCSRREQVEGCPTEDQSNGFLMNMDDQVEQFARVVRSDSELSGGFNAIGFSQGNLVIRGYIHRYNDPPVKNFLSMHGVMMGVAGLPQCPLGVPGIDLLCKSVDSLASHGIYTPFVQRRLAQANYYRDPKHIGMYLREGHFLPYINNEVEGGRNSTYTHNFRALEKLVLVMAADDTMVHPKESEHFGFFKEGSMFEMLDMHATPWYVGDWFGLRTLDEAGRVDRYTTPGNHLRFTRDFLLQLVRRYFTMADFQI